MSVARYLASLFAGLAILMALIMPAFAEDANARVIVPDHPGGAVFTGCYDVQQNLYGPYRMSFCLKQRGTYSVRGGGVRCNGTLNWSASGRDISIKLKRTSCGNGVAWSGDTMSCRGTSLLSGLLARIIVPDLPVLAALRCVYDPSVKGEKSVTITARRQN